MKTISIDIETYSSVDLAKAGVYRYVESEDFEILLFGYSVDGGETRVVDLACGEKIPADIIAALTDSNIKKFAFNAQFERICLSRFLGLQTGTYLSPDSWYCTMVWAATLGLPLSLEKVGEVLGIEKKKLTFGKELIRYFCKPCEPTAANGHRTRNYPYHNPEKWDLFKDYNERAHHLRHGFDFSEHARRNDDARFARNDEAKAGYTELAEKYQKNDAHKYYAVNYIRISVCYDKEISKYSYLRADYHKFIRKGINKLSEIGYEIIFSRNFSVKHIGERGYDENHSGNNESPDFNASHSKKRHNECGNKKNSYDRECVWHVKSCLFHF